MLCSPLNLIGHVTVKNCLPINVQYKPISLQYSLLSAVQPIRIESIIGNF